MKPIRVVAVGWAPECPPFPSPQGGARILLIKAISPKRRRKRVCMDAEEFQREHERLLAVLRSPSHADDLDEAREQAAELTVKR